LAIIGFTNEVCEVTPFLDSYEPVKEVMVARCSTVWTSPNTGHQYLLVGDQMLWFRSQMDHSLTHSQSQFGIDCNDDFIPFNTMGTIVYFESRVLTDWEMHNLPIIMLTGEDWDPVNVGFGNGHSSEQAEMQMI
jgi:hypothetical protein